MRYPEARGGGGAEFGGKGEICGGREPHALVAQPGRFDPVARHIFITHALFFFLSYHIPHRCPKCPLSTLTFDPTELPQARRKGRGHKQAATLQPHCLGHYILNGVKMR
jgi:hypothetical protein